MNVIFISPQFPYYYYNFCERLKERGANVLGIGDTPYELISDDTKKSVTEYYYVDSLEDYDQVYRAVAFYISKYGRIDWIESENEYWLSLEAKLRTDYNVNTGPKADQIDILRHKSLMKDVYKSHNIPVADYRYLNSIDDAYNLIDKVGYPVIIKPDDGMGASQTYKVKNEKQLKRIYESLDQNVQFIVEDFVPGQVETFEGITDSQCNILVSSSHVMCDAVMDMVNDHLDTMFYSQPVEGKDIYNIGKRTVDAFNAKSRFFHFEFIRLSEDKDYLGKKGDLVGLEVNMRAPGAYIPEMMNYACDVDVYTIWADMLLYDTCYFDVERKYHVGYVGRRNDKQYALSDHDVKIKYHKELVLEADVPEALAEAMSDHVFIYRTDSVDKLNYIMKDIVAHKKITKEPQQVKTPKQKVAKVSKPKRKR